VQQLGGSSDAESGGEDRKDWCKVEDDNSFRKYGSRDLEYISAQKVFTIVVGMKGLHGVSRIRSLGSVSRRIVENSTRPVLIVP